MKKLKIISIILSAALGLSVLAACNKKPTPPSSAVIVQTTTTEMTTELAPVITSEETEETEETTEETTEMTTEATTAETETTTTEEEEDDPTPTPKPTSTPKPAAKVKLGTYLKDEANVIKDDAGLEAKLAEFEKATKISAVIYTVKSDLKGDDFRAYAKSIYKSNYKDQDHFLIVYRVAKSGGGWSWTTSIGSKAYAKLKKAGINSTYSNDLSKALSGNKDKGKGFISFFDKTQKTITGKG